MVLGNTWQGEKEAAATAAAALKLHQELAAGRLDEGGVLGLVTASAAINLAVCKPPAWIHSDTYFLAVSGFFFVGVAQLGAAVWAQRGHRGRHGTGRNFMYASCLGQLAAATCLSVASLIW
ncbi:hypothetical protein HU200_031268 [Digitaria exilis]|uniref:Uncharacterized protein n=1 Tax=Digitaria exilis TaxID=1010633 RepID=A0A835BQA5_9POAL|nr:hypothetical protein HU200_031268 [Digitaria exilis]